MELVESSEELFKDPTAEVKAIFGEKIDAIKLMKLVTAAGGVSQPGREGGPSTPAHGL
jgi:hypothetical protein